MQFKILHRIIGVNNLLFKMNIVSSQKCLYCQLYNESIEHLFFDCLEVKSFWLQLSHILQQDGLLDSGFTKQDVLLGIYRIGDYQLVNLLILFGKNYIFSSRNNPLTLWLRNI